MLLCTLVIKKFAIANTSQLQLTLDLSSQAGHARIRAYQRSAALAFDNLEDSIESQNRIIESFQLEETLRIMK